MFTRILRVIRGLLKTVGPTAAGAEGEYVNRLAAVLIVTGAGLAASAGIYNLGDYLSSVRLKRDSEAYAAFKAFVADLVRGQAGAASARATGEVYRNGDQNPRRLEGIGVHRRWNRRANLSECALTQATFTIRVSGACSRSNRSALVRSSPNSVVAAASALMQVEAVTVRLRTGPVRGSPVVGSSRW